MIIDHKLKNTFIKLIISEDQAVGIYEAELFLKGQPKDVFQRFLADEISHEKELIRIIDEMNWKFSCYQKLLLKMNRLLGWIIGIFLSIIPRRLCFIFHHLGEKKAVEGYDELRHFLDQNVNASLFESIQIKSRLEKIIESEKLHAETFSSLLDKK